MRGFGLLCLLFPILVSAQQLYWVSFSHKDSSYSPHKPERFLSARAIQRRQAMGIQPGTADLPIAPSFIATLEAEGWRVVGKSKWLNGVAVTGLSKEAAKRMDNYPFVQSVVELGMYKTPKNSLLPTTELNTTDSRFGKTRQLDTNTYGVAFKQLQLLNLPAYHKQTTGKGVWIAVLDAGFYKAHQHPAFDDLFKEGRILATRDFVVGDTNVWNDDDHGLAVLSCMASNQRGWYRGSAPDACYLLLRSEDADSEMPIEEILWAQAAEFADSMGADVVNSSLGYNEFDESRFNHTNHQLNGQTTFVSKAAAMAVATGMIVVNSAGNEGNEVWHYVSVPADVQTVITVGGVDAQRNYVAFSSVGPTSDNRIKPDVMAQGDNVWVASSSGSYYQGDGTSYASPLMAGAIACLKQQYPHATPLQLLKVLQQSSDQYYKPTKYTGYGIPDIVLAAKMLGLGYESLALDTVLDIRALKDRKLHLTLVSSTATALTVEVLTQDGVPQFETTLRVEKGLNRLALNRSKRLAKGTYTVVCKSLLPLNQSIDVSIP